MAKIGGKSNFGQWAQTHPERPENSLFSHVLLSLISVFAITQKNKVREQDEPALPAASASPVNVS